MTVQGFSRSLEPVVHGIKARENRINPQLPMRPGIRTAVGTSPRNHVDQVQNQENIDQQTAGQRANHVVAVSRPVGDHRPGFHWFSAQSSFHLLFDAPGGMLKAAYNCRP